MIWVKMLIGALIVLLIQVLTQTRFFYLAALAPLFPTFTLISHFLVATQRGATDFKVALIFSMFGILPHLAYTLTVFFAINHFGLAKALLLGIFIWLIASILLVLAWQHYQL